MYILFCFLFSILSLCHPCRRLPHPIPSKVPSPCTRMKRFIYSILLSPCRWISPISYFLFFFVSFLSTRRINRHRPYTANTEDIAEWICMLIIVQTRCISGKDSYSAVIAAFIILPSSSSLCSCRGRWLFKSHKAKTIYII